MTKMVPRIRVIQRTFATLNEDAMNVPLPPTPKTERLDRKPLAELQVGENEQGKIVLDVKLKLKKASDRIKYSKQKLAVPEVLEDEYESSNSSAVEEVRRELIAVYNNNNFVAPYLDRRPQTPPSKAVRAARRKLNSPARTSRFSTPESQTVSPNTKRVIQNNSSILVIETRTPTKMDPNAKIVEEILEDRIIANYSPAAAITPITSISNSSPTRSPHVKDSVEAVDALTEALKELETTLPVIMDDVQMVSFKAASASPSPKAMANTTKKRVASVPTRQKPAATSISTVQPVKKPLASKPVEVKPKISRTSLASSRTTEAKSVVSKTPIKTPTTAGRPAPPRTSLPAQKVVSNVTTPRTPVPRVASVAKAPFVPAKSTKTPTRPNFTLPSEAITARKKAQLEARLEQEEEERKARREFKARPVPSRNSIGSSEILYRKRQSLANDAQIKASKGVSTQAKTTGKPVPRPPAKFTPKPTTRISTTRVSPPIRPPAPTPFKSAARTASKITSSAIKSTGPSPKPPLKPLAAKVAAKPKQNSSPLGPKEPTKLMTVQEKADAAKKARKEAAEKGRQASREWAELQRKKRASLSAQVAKET